MTPRATIKSDTKQIRLPVPRTGQRGAARTGDDVLDTAHGAAHRNRRDDAERHVKKSRYGAPNAAEGRTTETRDTDVAGELPAKPEYN